MRKIDIKPEEIVELIQRNSRQIIYLQRIILVALLLVFSFFTIYFSGINKDYIKLTWLSAGMLLVALLLLLDNIRINRKRQKTLNFLSQKPGKIVWIYKEQRLGSLVRLGPATTVSREINLCFHTINGKKSTFPITNDDADRVIHLCQHYLPGASYGYTKSVARQYKKDRDKLQQISIVSEEIKPAKIKPGDETK